MDAVPAAPYYAAGDSHEVTMRVLSFRGLLPALVVLLSGACASAPPAPAATQNTAAAGASAAFHLAGLPEPAPLGVAEYAARRQALHSQMGDGVLVVFGSPHPAFDYLPFAQTADFRYLTGIMEPGAAYIAVKQGASVVERLFMDRRDPAREQWEGVRLGPEGARQRTGIPAYTNDRTALVLDSLVAAPRGAVLDDGAACDRRAGRKPVVRPAGADAAAGPAPGHAVAEHAGRHPQAARREVHAELDRIRRAVHISVLAHREAMRSACSRA
jgi:Xaa-Pro aminopeptidase